MSEVASAIGVAAFAGATYADGNLWTSGLLTGLAACWLIKIGLEWLDARATKTNGL